MNFPTYQCKQTSLFDERLKHFSNETIVLLCIKINNNENKPYILKSLDPLINDGEKKLLGTFSNVF